MQALTANYSTPAELQRVQNLSSTVCTIQHDRFSSPSLSITVEDQNSNESGLNMRIFNLLSKFEELEGNWDEDGAMAPAQKSIEEARFISRILGSIGQNIFHTAPGPNGEVMLDLRNTINGRSVELIFYPNKSLAVFFPLDETPKQEEFSIGNLPIILEWLNSK